ncbi:MAG: hemerythrin domain-containing protein [Myxococcota bacterium]
MPRTTQETCALVLEEHRLLRKRMDALEELMQQPSHHATLRAEGLSFLVQLGVHLNAEEALLLPLIRALPTLGEPCGERLTEEHRSQRRDMLELRTLLLRADTSGAAVAKLLRTFIRGLRMDMAQEEEGILREVSLELSDNESVAS